ncbi:DRAP deaminase [Dinochytrium kinnereticum]|nr:DRAP deaminase [Dinochytrium kinnereticum]
MTDVDAFYMTRAVEEARQSEPVETAYCVGAVLVRKGAANTNDPNAIISTGFSRELPGNTHAEEVCLLKLSNLDSARGATIYTTMEPCSTRLSGKKPCCEHLVNAGVERVVVGCREPTVFVADCKGTDFLAQHHIRVEYMPEFQGELIVELNQYASGKRWSLLLPYQTPKGIAGVLIVDGRSWHAALKVESNTHYHILAC